MSTTVLLPNLKSWGEPTQELHDYVKAKEVGLCKALDLFSRGHDSSGEHTSSYPGYKEGGDKLASPLGISVVVSSPNQIQRRTQ